MQLSWQDGTEDVEENLNRIYTEQVNNNDDNDDDDDDDDDDAISFIFLFVCVLC